MAGRYSGCIHPEPPYQPHPCTGTWQTNSAEKPLPRPCPVDRRTYPGTAGLRPTMGRPGTATTTGCTLRNRDLSPLSLHVQKTYGYTGKGRTDGKQYPASLLGEAIRFHTILEHIDNSPGVYEISRDIPSSYPCGESNIVYIGRSGQLRKRFLSYRAGGAHTAGLKELIKQGQLYVRVAYTDQHIALEKKMVDTFEKQLGALPRYNYNRP